MNVNKLSVWLLIAVSMMNVSSAMAQTPQGMVKAYQKVDSLNVPIGTNTYFGESVTSIGDINGDGIADLAVGADHDNDGGLARGAVWILLMNANGTVLTSQKISSTQGNFAGVLNNSDNFGHSVASVGDLNGDGIADLAVGAPGDDNGGSDKGAVWILFLNNNGTVQGYQKISSTQGGFSGSLNVNDRFGTSIAYLVGSTPKIAVGAYQDDDGGTNKGAVWILSLNTNGTVQGFQKISATQGGFGGPLNNSEWFGWSVTSLGDVNGDGNPDLAVGATGDVWGASNQGAVWILFLNANCTVQSFQKISYSQGGFVNYTFPLGNGVASLGDMDGDGIPDLAVGAGNSAWIIFLNSNGTMKANREIQSGQEGFTGTTSWLNDFGISVASLGDLNGDGVKDLVVGSPYDPQGGNSKGAIWNLFLQSPTLIMTSNIQQISIGSGATQTLSINAGSAYAGKFYVVLGSLANTPPIQLGNFTIPLTMDFYFNWLFANPNSWHLSNGIGVLGANGDATATVSWPVGFVPSVLIGSNVYYDVVVYDANGTILKVGSAVSATFVQ